MKNLLPNDRYIIQLHKPFCEDYVMALTHLYQPLIGMNSITLYFTLTNEIEFLEGPSTHHTLMNITGMDLDQIYQARLKLEAIGLLKTYVNEEDIRTYYYVLQPPFSAKEFFQDSMLSILLEHHIGEQLLDRMRKKVFPEVNVPASIIDKTKSFEDVFTTSIRPQKPVLLKTSEKKDSNEQISKMEHSVDFHWIEQALQNNEIRSEKVLTKDNRDFIINLTRIYKVDNVHLEKAILWSINENMELLREELHEACKDYYAKQYDSKAPKLLPKQEIQEKQENKKTPTTKQGKLMEHFESITHREILEDYSKTGHASEQEIKMLTNVMFQHGLSQSVMNVLVHYVLQKTDLKLTRNYIEKIATHWARKNVQTVQQAMELAKAESGLYQTWGTKRAPSKKKEVLPDWFKKQKEAEAKSDAGTSTKQQSRDISLEKQELEKALKNFGSKTFNH